MTARSTLIEYAQVLVKVTVGRKSKTAKSRQKARWSSRKIAKKISQIIYRSQQKVRNLASSLYKSFEVEKETCLVIYYPPFLIEVIYECDADINIKKLSF